jgi:hypothetical protein
VPPSQNHLLYLILIENPLPYSVANNLLAIQHLEYIPRQNTSQVFPEYSPMNFMNNTNMEKEFVVDLEIEYRVLYALHNRPISSFSLAICSVLYNTRETGLLWEDVAERMGVQPKQISGATSQLAQSIDDAIDDLEEHFGFTGYRLFFDVLDNGRLFMRPEMRKVIDQHQDLLRIMGMPLDEILVQHSDGFRLM